MAASDLILVCRFADKFAAIRINRGWNFGQVVKKICDRCSTVEPNSVILNYSLGDDDNLMLDNDEDLETMFTNAKRAGLDDVRVNVTDGNVFANNASNVVNMSPVCSSGSKAKQVIIYDDDDVIPSFCSQKGKKLLSSNWSEGITSVGQIFEGGASEFKDILRKYAIQGGFDYVLVKNDKQRVTAHCKHRTEKECMWHVHARICPPDEYFSIRTMTLDHTCGVVVRTLKNSRATAQLVSNLVGEDVRGTPRTRPVDVVKGIKKDYGLNISYAQAWWGVEKAKSQVFGSELESFSSLKWYIGAAKSTNPGSHLELDYDEETNRFERLFVAFGACIQGFNYCRPLIFLDATHLKGKHKGSLLAATSKNGNQGIYPICFAVVDAETYENWRWFLQHLRSSIALGRDITFVSDRNLGLVEARREVFPNSGHGYCILHLKRNLRNALKGVTRAYREKVIALFVRCAYAPTRELFHQSMSQLKCYKDKRVAHFLENLPLENWSNVFFRGQRYGEMTSNVAESFNLWIENERHLPITSLVDVLRVKMMNLISRRREEASKWESRICPEMDKRLGAAFNESKTWAVSESGDGVYEVHSQPNVTVYLWRRICSCQKWQLLGFPCSHAVVVISSLGKDHVPYVDPYLYTQTFRDLYSFSIQPIPNEWMSERHINEDVLLPPLCKRPPGRPRNQRIPSRGENMSMIRCGRCHKMGTHNRKSCKEAIYRGCVFRIAVDILISADGTVVVGLFLC